jgi:preprotein translocase subunit SecF
MLISLIATMAYIAIRFEYRFAISAIISLIHDPVLILGVFAFFHIEFNLIGLAALLTILGYSLNDTIVVYDRVRENFRKLRKASPLEVMNLSVNQTLSRTIMTSGLTLLVVLALLIFGGETLLGFSVALIIGIVIGTYSSIYIAGSLALWMGLDKKALIPAPKKALDDRP